MNQFIYTIGKGFAILTGITLFSHSRFMPSTLKTYLNPHPFFEENLKLNNDIDLPPNLDS